MKTNNLKMKAILKHGLMLSTLMLVTTQASALTTRNLCVGSFVKTLPGGEMITMWGFGDDGPSPITPTLGVCAATVPGPELKLLAGETVLTINLRNTLSDSVSVMIPGLSTTTAVTPVRVAGRVRSFTHDTPAAVTGTSDGTASYSFNAKAGTYLYQSGTHIAKQMQMGLYGAVVQNNSEFNLVGPVLATAYAGISYDHSITMLYSEIDPALHAAVAAGTYGTGAVTSTINFAPKYFLINGEAFSSTTANIKGGTPGSTTLFRFLNAGIETHVPVINGSHVDIIAEYGNPYPFPRKQYSVMLPAGQTRDAIMTAPAVVAPAVAVDYVIYDRRLRLSNSGNAGDGGMFSKINVATSNVNVNSTAAGTSSASNIASTGGGCSVQTSSRFDPMFPLLMLLSLGYFIRRVRFK